MVDAVADAVLSDQRLRLDLGWLRFLGDMGGRTGRKLLLVDLDRWHGLRCPKDDHRVVRLHLDTNMSAGGRTDVTRDITYRFSEVQGRPVLGYAILLGPRMEDLLLLLALALDHAVYLYTWLWKCTASSFSLPQIVYSHSQRLPTIMGWLW